MLFETHTRSKFRHLVTRGFKNADRKKNTIVLELERIELGWDIIALKASLHKFAAHREYTRIPESTQSVGLYSSIAFMFTK